MYIIQYEVAPAPHSEQFNSVGGAFALCFVRADSAEEAVAAAMLNFEENGWRVVSVNQDACPVTREEIEALDEPDSLEWFDQALEEGERYVFMQWPPEAQDGDPVH
jgi:hypothetical protein